MWYKNRNNVLKNLYKPSEIYHSTAWDTITVRSNSITIEWFATDEEAMKFIDYLFYEFGNRDRRTISYKSFTEWLATEDWNK